MIQNKNAYIFPSMLTQALTKAGYSSRKTLKYLADKGLIGVSVLKERQYQEFSDQMVQ